MDQKTRWALLGLFGGAMLMIGLWLFLTGSPSTTNPIALQENRGLRPLGPQKRPVFEPVGARSIKSVHDRVGAVRVVGLEPVPGADGPKDGEPDQIGEKRVYAMDQAGISAAVDSERSELEACYETALFHTPDLAGSMTLELQITPVEGETVARIETVDVDTDIDATIFEGCIATVFEDLRFHATEPTTVRYPLTFQADEEDEQVAGAPAGAPADEPGQP
ncbi:MAG: AgmX/PglI C-terminal domain-containing protein [Alphaproteobacteria bacterium]|nr:AgmX/PglI C-terminal domain-containing protein [Alphaproteobacteria bacterium]